MEHTGRLLCKIQCLQAGMTLGCLFPVIHPTNYDGRYKPVLSNHVCVLGYWRKWKPKTFRALCLCFSLFQKNIFHIVLKYLLIIFLPKLQKLQNLKMLQYLNVMQQLNKMYVKWNWLVLRERAGKGVMRQTGTRYHQPQVRAKMETGGWELPFVRHSGIRL